MRILVLLLLSFCIQGYSSTGFSQNTISLSVKNQDLKTVFVLIQQNSKYKILYNDNVVPDNKRLTLKVKDATINELMEKVLDNTGLHYALLDNNLVVIKASASETPVIFTIRGKVTDANGQPVGNVSVVEKNTTNGTTTKDDGSFSLSVKDVHSVLVFSHTEFETKEVTINNNEFIDISLQRRNSQLADVVVVGYGTQKRVSLTGSVSAVTAKDIITTKNENVQNMMAGKLPGLRVVQNTSEPGTFDNTFDIRGLGSPLIIIDGIPRDNIARLDPNDIESMSILKDASAAVYGVRAANGVVLITTKKGKNGALDITYSGNWGLQKPSGLPKTLDAIGYMTLQNEQARHKLNYGAMPFSDADMAPYLDGTKKTVDWYNLTYRKKAQQSQHNISVTGGNTNTNYFLSLGYTNQGGFFRTNDLNYKRYNVRSNISSKLTKNLTVDLNIAAILDQKNQPYNDAWWINRTLWRQVPTETPYANNNPAYLTNTTIEGENPVAQISSDISGYKKFNNYWFQSSIAMHYQIPYIQGLKLNGLFSYDNNISDNKIFQKSYNEYTYDPIGNTYNATALKQSPMGITRQYYAKPQTLSQISLNYDRIFAGDHSVNALVVLEQSVRNGDDFASYRDLSLPLDQLFAGNSLNQQATADGSQVYKNANRGVIGKLNYSFRSKYFAEFGFRYDGSSKFEESKQWGFFPEASVGWRISEENFFKSISALSFINNLKFRASYGKLGDDRASSYQFITGYNYPAKTDNTNDDPISSNRLPPGAVFNGAFVNSVSSKGIPNQSITWYVAKTANIGIDLEAWKGLLGVTAEIFRRDRTGLLATRVQSLPTVVGATLPQENLNGDRSEGFDMEINHRNNIGKFSYSAKFIFGYTRSRNLYIERANSNSSWDNWKNNNTDRFNNIWWAYGSNGQYQNYNDVLNSPVFVSKGTLPGDYAYQDWNGDGLINGDDMHPLAYGNGNKPLINYGFSLNGAYKGIDLTILLQGTGRSNVSYPEQLKIPLWGNAKSSGLEQFLDRWHPEDPNANPYDPNTKWVSGHFAYTGVTPDDNSSYNIQNAAYLRLKSVEIGYTIPNRFLSPIGIKNVRVYLNGYNLLTSTKLKYVDPEHPSGTYGYIYPLNKTFNAGLSVKL